MEGITLFNTSALPENFVSLAAKFIEGEAKHAAILIRHQKKNYLCHFPGQTPPEIIENFDEDGWYIYKIWEIINSDDESDVGAFLQQCVRICKNSKITYSYIADGSKHDFNGVFESKVGLPELGTCVSFCVNVLTNWLIDSQSYFHLDDWDDSELNEHVDAWAIAQVKKKHPDLDWTLYNAFKKRITPLEYLCSAFLQEAHPITKNKIAAISEEVSSGARLLLKPLETPPTVAS